MSKNGLSFLRAPGKLIQVGMTVGQSRYRNELDGLRLSVISQWPQMMRSSTHLMTEFHEALLPASEGEGVFCLYLKVRNQGKISLYLEFANSNSLDAILNPSIMEHCRQQIPLLCWLLRNQPGAETGWEQLTHSTLISGTNAVESFGLAKVIAPGTFSPWGSVIVTAESLFPDILTDLSSAEKDHFFYLAASRLFDQIDRGVVAEEVEVLWSHDLEASIRENTPIISDVVHVHSRGRVWATMAAAIIAGFLGSWFVTNEVKSAVSTHRTQSSSTSREMKFFLWNRHPAAKELKAEKVEWLKPSPPKSLEVPKTEAKMQGPKTEEVTKKRTDAMNALGLQVSSPTAPSEQEARRADALKALTDGK